MATIALSTPSQTVAVFFAALAGMCFILDKRVPTLVRIMFGGIFLAPLVALAVGKLTE